MCVYCFLILRVAEGLAIALSGTSSGLAQGLPGLSVTPPGALVSLSKVGVSCPGVLTRACLRAVARLARACLGRW